MLVLADVILLFALVLFTISGWNYTVAQIPHLGTTIKVSLALFYPLLRDSSDAMDTVFTRE